jgi:hypothetical protein
VSSEPGAGHTSSVTSDWRDEPRIEVLGRLAHQAQSLPADIVDNDGSGGRDRTRDLRIMIPLLRLGDLLFDNSNQQRSLSR